MYVNALRDTWLYFQIHSFGCHCNRNNEHWNLSKRISETWHFPQFSVFVGYSWNLPLFSWKASAFSVQWDFSIVPCWPVWLEAVSFVCKHFFSSVRFDLITYWTVTGKYYFVLLFPCGSDPSTMNFLSRYSWIIRTRCFRDLTSLVGSASLLLSSVVSWLNDCLDVQKPSEEWDHVVSLWLSAREH